MYVIFDMDGVIVDSEAVYLAGYLHTAELYDLPIEDMRTAVGRATGVTDNMERAIMVETFGHLPQFLECHAQQGCLCLLLFHLFHAKILLYYITSPSQGQKIMSF